jgi:DNA-binding HxlR family transcriptional regulator
MKTMKTARGRRGAPRKRGYGQYCGLAKALDVIGDRWTLLIVRELLIRGSCRYTDLRNGLPGVATNLLVARLRELEQGGIIRREAAPPPIATTLFQLTPRGAELREVVHAIGRWGGPLVRERAPDDAFCSHWIAMPLELHLKDRTPGRPPVAIAVHTGNEPMVVETADGAVRVRPGRLEQPDGVLIGPPDLIVGVLTGKVSLREARRRGLGYDGDPAALRRIQPVDRPEGGR